MELISETIGELTDRANFSQPLPEANHGTTVHVIRDLSELRVLREFWDLHCTDPNADHDLFLVDARCRQDIKRPHVMAVYRDGQPVCLLVGRVEERPVELKLGYAVVGRPAATRLFFLPGGFMGDTSRGNTELLLTELKACLDRGEGDLAELSRVVPGSDLDTLALKAFPGLRRASFSPINEHRWLELPESFELFLSSLSRKSRHEVKRHQKKLTSDFGERARIRCYRSENDFEQFVRDVECVAAQTYQRGLKVGFAPTSEVLESLRAAAKTGQLRGCVLYLDGEPSAFFIGKHYKAGLHGHYMGFNPAFAKYSPGLMILMHSIEDCYDTGTPARHVDLGWGDRQYKRMLCNRTRQDGPMYLFRASWKARRLNLLFSASAYTNFIAKKNADKYPLLQKAKKAWQSLYRTEPQLASGSETSLN